MDNWQEILKAYAQGPELLSRAVDEIPEEILDQAFGDENWSIRAIIQFQKGN